MENQTANLYDQPQETRDVSALSLAFCTILSNLNAISEQQMKSLLSIAVTAAEVARSLSSSGLRTSTGSLPSESDDLFSSHLVKLTDLAEEIKQISNSRTQASPVENNDAAKAPDAGRSTEFFADTISNINLAMQNSVANQQELNVLSQAILARAALLVLSAVRADESSGSKKEAASN